VDCPQQSVDHRLTRRSFLAAAPVGIAALRAAPKGPTLAAGCRDAMLKQVGGADCWSAAKQVGAEVIEVMVDDKLGLPLLSRPQQPYSLATSQGIRHVSADLKTAGQRISAFCVASRFDERPGFECDFGARLARIAQQMGVRAIRIDVVSYKMPADKFIDGAVAALKKLTEATKDINVSFGVENHGPTGNDPAFLVPLLDRVGSKRLGVTLDTGNFYWFGHPLSKVYELIEMFAPRVVHTHCKNIRYPADQREVRRPTGWEYAKYEAPVNQGDIDFARVVKILRSARYTGDLCVENETLPRLPQGDRSGVLTAEIAYLKELRGRA
jgi:sugar phosphate isomerase/epimerase